ncbi:hypothetical protein PRZ48_013569 [Zasmidium cellare]|uniref:Amidohydrolase-related domain-containing protein n=1 Tax=Zasmidium cellare TaxID=395010 RepID=A0ABR0E1E3_ZASCE|nr:hypothetical protein PRZ48_013569 [Zasmidium cellare]
MATPTPHLPKRLIALEEHALFPSLQPIGAFYNASLSSMPGARTKLEDIGEGRIADMDSAHITTQVLSTIPGLASTDPEGCKTANDALAAAIATHPTRLAGFAALPMQYPQAARAELRRAVRKLGLAGAMIDNHLPEGQFYDSRIHDGLFATAEELDVPIYIHPTPPTASQIESFQGNYPMRTTNKLASSAWNWHASVGQHLIRLYASGLFTRHPNLKIIIGHDGECLPMMIDRVDSLKLREDMKFSEVWDRNVWVTTAGFFSLRAFEMLLKVTRVERVMFSVDYPLVEIGEGWKFVQRLAGCGILSAREMDLFAFGNAERLFKVETEP